MKVAILAVMFFAAAIANWRVHQMSPADAWLPTSIVFLLLGIGILARQRWIEAAIFGAGLYFTTIWLSTVALIALEGPWPYSTVIESVISIIPGLTFVMFWFLMWRLVHFYFAKATDAE